MAKMQKHAARADERTLAPLEPAEQALFLSLLTVLVNGGNPHARAKMRLQSSEDEKTSTGF